MEGGNVSSSRDEDIGWFWWGMRRWNEKVERRWRMKLMYLFCGLPPRIYDALDWLVYRFRQDNVIPVVGITGGRDHYYCFHEPRMSVFERKENEGGERERGSGSFILSLAFGRRFQIKSPGLYV